MSSGVGTYRATIEREIAAARARTPVSAPAALPLVGGRCISGERRHAVLEAALAAYVADFSGKAGTTARAYLCAQRAIDPAVADAAGVGYLPPRARPLALRLVDRGFSPEEIRAADVARCREEEVPTAENLADYPAGGGYLTLPVRDPDGMLIGFKYRAVPGQVREGALRFTGTAGRVGAAMFGADRIPPGVTEAFVVEGEIDQLSAESARRADPSLGWTLALHGKEISEPRLEFLATRFSHLTLMLDMDEGGWDGILRGGRRLGMRGVVTTIMQMPQGQDPNDILRVGDGPGLAAAMRHLPRVSLLEAHASVLLARGVAARDPVFAARDLRATAEALPARAWAADPRLAERVCRLTALPPAVFDGLTAPTVLAHPAPAAAAERASSVPVLA